MHTLLRRTGLAAMLGAALVLTSCIKFKQTTVVMPDGSGKLTMRIGMNSMLSGLAAMGEEGESENPFSDLSSAKLEEESAGFVAFSETRETEESGWKFIEFDAYFDDVSKVRLYDTDDETGERKVQLAYKVTKDDSGWLVELDNAMFDDLADKANEQEDEETTPEMEEMMKNMMRSMLEGFEIRMSLQMPGAVTESAGFHAKEGNTASLVFGLDEMLDKEKMKKFAETKEFNARCGATNLGDEALAAWTKELADAKASWKQRKAAEVVDEQTGDDAGAPESGTPESGANESGTGE